MPEKGNKDRRGNIQDFQAEQASAFRYLLLNREILQGFYPDYWPQSVSFLGLVRISRILEDEKKGFDNNYCF